MPDREPIGRHLDMLCDAAGIVAKSQYATLSLIQRRVRVGFATAVRLLTMLEEHGITGPYVKGHADVLVTEDMLPGVLATLREIASKEERDAGLPA